jgi:hypothetical protein
MSVDRFVFGQMFFLVACGISCGQGSNPGGGQSTGGDTGTVNQVCFAQANDPCPVVTLQTDSQQLGSDNTLVEKCVNKGCEFTPSEPHTEIRVSGKQIVQGTYACPLGTVELVKNPTFYRLKCDIGDGVFYDAGTRSDFYCYFYRSCSGGNDCAVTTSVQNLPNDASRYIYLAYCRSDTGNPNHNYEPSKKSTQPCRERDTGQPVCVQSKPPANPPPKNEE